MIKETKDNFLAVCLCPTFNRYHLLEESIQCFIDQDYPCKEMIILNDEEGVELEIENCPQNIKIYNCPTRFNSLGEKRNYLKQLCCGDYYFIWDDDDLYPSYRISESIYMSQQYPEYDIIKAKTAFISIEDKTYKIAQNHFHSQACIRKEYMEKTMYPGKNNGEDRVFEKSGANVGIIDVFPSFWAVLRYGMNTQHISGIADEKLAWETIGKLSTNKGRILIKPRFHHDYWEDMRKVLNDINGFWGEEWMIKISRIKE